MCHMQHEISLSQALIQICKLDSLCISQDSSKMENVKVQLNPQPQQVIIRTSEHEGVTELDQSLTIHLPDGLSHSERSMLFLSLYCMCKTAYVQPRVLFQLMHNI